MTLRPWAHELAEVDWLAWRNPAGPAAPRPATPKPPGIGARQPPGQRAFSHSVISPGNRRRAHRRRYGR